MGGTRIVVWKMKDLIKIGIIAVVGLAAIIALVIALTPSGGGSAGTSGRAVFVPGTYSAQIILHNEPVSINVTVTEREITAVEMGEMMPSQQVMYPLFVPTMEALSREIIRRQTTNVTIDSGAVVTSSILLNAVNVALEQAVYTLAE